MTSETVKSETVKAETVKAETVKVGDAEITLETGRIARQAHGAVVVRHGATFVLATVVADERAGSADFFPLTVNYREKMAATGRIPGNYFRRETRQSEREVLVSRLIDRTLRPLFPDGYRNETHIVVTVYSADPASDLEGLSLIAAAAAVHLSAVPFDGPVAGFGLIRRDGRYKVLPAPGESDLADLDLMVSASRGGLVMVEGSARSLPEETLLEAFDHATEALAPVLDALDRLRAAAGRPKRALAEPADLAGLRAEVRGLLGDAIAEALAVSDKVERRSRQGALHGEAVAALGEDAGPVFEKVWKEMARARTLDGQRIGGRAADDVRTITCETGLLPANHGSALFTRGETQALVSATLGGHRDRLDVESLGGSYSEHFLLHYNFPAFSVGEARADRGPGRREIGHGNLARRALAAVMPTHKEFPYTIRVVSDITESNGSSSMATVCGGTLALLNAGVPLSAPVAGIAMGLIADGGRFAILSDILGDEDHLGDMDFKVAGSADAVTAVQLDNKIGSLPREVLEQALAQARDGRRRILEAMQPAIEAQTGRPPAHAPRHVRVKISPNRIGLLIGPGGRNLQQLQSRTGTKVDVSDDGTVTVMGKDEASTRDAVRAIRDISIELEKGALYLTRVVSVKEFGVFVRFAEHEGLVHVSELAAERVADPGTVAREGDEMLVRLLGADDKGRLKLSRKAALGDSPLEAVNA